MKVTIFQPCSVEDDLTSLAWGHIHYICGRVTWWVTHFYPSAHLDSNLPSIPSTARAFFNKGLKLLTHWPQCQCWSEPHLLQGSSRRRCPPHQQPWNPSHSKYSSAMGQEHNFKLNVISTSSFVGKLAIPSLKLLPNSSTTYSNPWSNCTRYVV